MITRVHFHNCGVLRDAVLPLEPITVIIGPNGSGKTTALTALSTNQAGSTLPSLLSAAPLPDGQDPQPFVAVDFWFGPSWQQAARVRFNRHPSLVGADGKFLDELRGDRYRELDHGLSNTVHYRLDPWQLIKRQRVLQAEKLSATGENITNVLDTLRDRYPERFEDLTRYVNQLAPEFDRILFDTDPNSERTWALRLAESQKMVLSHNVSEGTRLMVALGAIAHLPDAPTLLMIEEPDRGVHPRLLRVIKDTLETLAFPAEHGSDRPPVQIIVTTHSPLFLSLFSEHPERIVIASKQGEYATFKRLSDEPHLSEMLEGASLGEVWYSGALGGVPAESPK